MKRIYVTTGFLATFLLASLTGLAQTQSRSDILKEIEAKRAELVALEKMYLAPGEEDRLKYAEFLRQPDTGLIRLLPREKFDSEVYKANKPTRSNTSNACFNSVRFISIPVTVELGIVASIAVSQPLPQPTSRIFNRRSFFTRYLINLSDERFLICHSSK